MSKRIRKITNNSVVGSAVKMLRDIWTYSDGKKYVIFKLFVSILGVIPSIITTIIPGLILNELLYGILSIKLICLIAIIICVPMALKIFNSLVGRYIFRLNKRLNYDYLIVFYRHLSAMDYEELEKPDIQDLKVRAADAIPYRMSVVEQLCSIVSTILGIATISYILSRLSPLIVVSQMLIVLINSRISVNTEKKSHDIVFELQKKMRRQWGFTNTLDKIEYAKDIRMYDADDLLIKKIGEFQKQIDEDALKNTAVTSNSNIAQTLISATGQIVIYSFIVFSVLKSDMPVGNITIFISAATQFTNFLNSIMKTYVAQKKNIIKMNDYDLFIQATTKNKNSAIIPLNYNADSKFVFENVSFKYPGSEKYAIHNLNLSFKTGEHICVVGPNGAGKTTFVKLITRLYEPTEGKITFNDINIVDFDIDEYQHMFSSVFQDATKFYLTIKENISLSEQCDELLLENSCKKSGISKLTSNLKRGYDTQIGKWIDPEGIELSGGESQALAIARALYHGGEIYILDEPTAALDPSAEYEIYTQFHNMIKDKTAILITHRLSAVQLADKVAVFDDGQIIEYGTHSELYSKGGKYREMFDKQAQFYVNANHDDKEDDPINQTSNK